MKQLNLCLWLCLISYLANAQSATISWSPLQVRPKHKALQKIFHVSEKGFYTYTCSPYDNYTGYFVEKFDANNMLEFRKEIISKDKKMYIKDVFPCKIGFVVVYIKYIKDKIVFFGQKYSFAGEPTSEPYEIGQMLDLSYIYKINFISSSDESKILAYQVQKAYDHSSNVITKIENPVLQVLAFDIEEGALWSKIIEYKPYYGSFYLEGDAKGKFMIDNEGRFYMLTVNTPSKAIRYDYENEKMEECLVPLEGSASIWNSSSSWTFNSTMDKIIVTGIGYVDSEKAKHNMSQSVVYARIDVESFKLEIVKTIPFRNKIAAKIKQFEDDCYSFSYDLRRSIVKPDDGMIITIESQYANPPGRQAFMSVYVFNVNPDGTLIGEGNIIPKYQKGNLDSEAENWSFTPIYQNGTIHFFYFDNPENLLQGAGQKDIETISNSKKAKWVMATIDKNGQLKREQMDYTLGFNTLKFKRLTSNKFLVYQSTFKDFKFGTLIIQ